MFPRPPSRPIPFIGTRKKAFSETKLSLRVPMSGIEPLSRAYESLVLTIELHRQIMYKLTQFLTDFNQVKMKNQQELVFHFRVAGARIERASSGYEPDEIPLLYPAIYLTS